MKQRVKRGALQRLSTMLLMMLLTVAAWAENVTVNYIDADGQTQSVSATVLTGTESEIGSSGQTTWYVVNSNISHSGQITFNGNLNIILADGYTMTTSSDDEGIYGASGSTLTIYGQTLGSGTLDVTSNRNYGSAIDANGGTVTINGGTVTATASSGYGICARNDVTINGGTVTATCKNYGISGNGTVTINGGTINVTSEYYGIFSNGTVTINGGGITTNSETYGIFSTGTVTINGGGVNANGGLDGIFSSGTITLGLTGASDFITVNSYHGTVNIADGQRLTDGTNFYTGNDVNIPQNKTLRQVCFTDNGDNTYTIYNATGWGIFCDALQDNDTYNRFSGKTVYLAGDIGSLKNPVTRMAGTSKHDFCGTFDGQNHTLYVNISSDDRDYTAPFSYVSTAKANPGDENNSPAVIRNLEVVGEINATKQYAGGIVGCFWGTLTIKNCTSNVVINTDSKHAAGFIGRAQGDDVTITNCNSSSTIISTVSGDGTHGGFIGGSKDGITIDITGCVFGGSLIGNNTTHCSGFVGYNSGTLSITNSLFYPGQVGVSGDGSATFARGNEPTITNSYYTETLGTAQGKQRRIIEAGTNVIISSKALTGNIIVYNTSGINAYSGGGLYCDSGDEESLYYGNGDPVNLTLSNSATAPLGYQYGYTASAGTLTGSTLTMPDADVTVNLGSLSSDGQSHSITYVRADGTTSSQNAIALDETMNVLGKGGQTTWYFVGKDISRSGLITFMGNLNIILADGYTMTTSSNSNGIYGADGTLTIYGQTLGSGTLDVTSNNYAGGAINANGGTVTINGGTINVTATANAGIGIVGNYVTINGGTVNATATAGIGIGANNDVTINGGCVNAIGNYNGIYNSNGTVTINGGCVTANGKTYGIYNPNGTLTLGWTNADDYITSSFVSTGTNTVTIADGKSFYNGSEVLSGTVSTSKVGDKTLVPAVILADNADNTSAIATATTACTGDKTLVVQLAGRTLYKDGDWNTLCLPFNVTVGSDVMTGATAMTLNDSESGFDASTGMLTLYFDNVEEGNTITAGTPFIVKWTGEDITDPVFTSVTINNVNNDVTSTDGKVSFIGNYDPVTLAAGEGNYYLGTNNKLYTPSTDRTMNAFRAYFHIGTPSSIKRITLNFGENEPITGIMEVKDGQSSMVNGQSGWYTLQGVKLPAEPTVPGIYIKDGVKVIK